MDKKDIVGRSAGAGAAVISSTASAADRARKLNSAVGRFSPVLIVPVFTVTSLATNVSGGVVFIMTCVTTTSRERLSWSAWWARNFKILSDNYSTHN